MRPLMFRARVVLADGSSHMAYPDVGETQGKFLWLYEEYEVMQILSGECLARALPSLKSDGI